MSAPLLQVQGLKSGYGAVEVLRGVDLVVEPGQTVALLGSNGAGKTTLNLTLSGLVATRAGRVQFEGRDITGWHYRRVVGQGLIHVPEGRKVFPNLSVHENLELGAFTRGRERRAQNLERIYAIFPRLKERTTQLAGTLSGGEQQMLAIGRGLMAKPPDPGRAFSGPVAAAGGRDVRPDRSPQARWPGGAAGGAERGPVAGHCRPGLCDGKRSDQVCRTAVRTAGQRHPAPGLPGHVKPGRIRTCQTPRTLSAAA